MLIRLIAWSLRNRYLVLVLTGVLAAAGGFALSAMNVDAFPDTTPVQVQINTVSPSLVPEEVERQITFPVELAIGGLPGLQQVRSLSQFGLSQVVVTFDDGINIYFARQLISERLGTVELPPETERPQMGPVATGLGEVLHYLVLADGEAADPTALRTLQDWTIKPAMRPVPGTAEVNSWGGFEKQYQIRVDPVRLIKHDLSFDQVIHAVRANNLNVGGGTMPVAGEVLVVHGIGRTNTPRQIGDIVVTARGGTPIRVRDVAEVAVGHAIRRGVITADGEREAVLGLGFMLMGENSYAVTRRLRDRLDEVKRDLPAGTRVDLVYDRTALVDEVIGTVRNNLFEGGLLVVAVLYVLLGNLRAGLIVAPAIPLSMLFAFCGMWWLGIAGTLLSLGAIDFGIVVDSSVVVVENVIRRLGHAGPDCDREAVVRDAAAEVRRPTVFGQLIIMIVYLPILTLEGVEGKMFRPMALTVIFVLIGSLVLSLTLVPALSYLLLPRKVVEKPVLLVVLARRAYGPVLRLAMRLRVATVGLAGCCLLAGGLVAAGMGSEFVPRLSEGAVVLGILRMPGTSLEESAALNMRIERSLRQRFPDEIDRTWSRLGAPEVATDAGSLEDTDVFITLKPRSRWTVRNARGGRVTTQAELVDLMEKEVEDIPGQLHWFTQPIEMRINEMISGARADVALKLFGEDLDVLQAKGRELEDVLRSVDGCADLNTRQISGLPILRVRVKQDEIARYGVSAESVLSLVESLGGKTVGTVTEGQLPFPLLVRLPERLRQDPRAVATIPVAAASGELIPLERLASVEVVQGPKLIERDWCKRRLAVQCNVRNRDVGSFVAEAQKKIERTVQLPRGYRVEWGGQFENMERARTRLLVVVPAALGLIVGLLYLSCRNVADTASVFLSVPFACVGGVLALWVRDMPLSVSASVGFITLSGVSVLNSMIVVTVLRNLLRAGSPRAGAVGHATATCLRTVLMTALVASVGFIPMAVSSGMGAEVQRPLATVVIGGVISSTLFTLLVLPLLYLFGPDPDPNVVKDVPTSGHDCE